MVNLYSEFLEAEKRIAKILRLKSVTFKNTKYETPKVGVAYM